MADALAITEVSMLNSMQHLNLVSHNLANANTTGYKRDISVTRAFSEHLSAGLLEKSSRPIGLKMGSIQPMTKGVADHRPGVLRFTGNALDIAIEGEGYFKVDTPNGTLYTRQGTFTVNASGSLVTSGGLQINMKEGDVRLTTDTPRIDKQGKVWDDDQYLGQLTVVRFPNPQARVKVGGGLFAGELAQSIVQDDDIAVRQGFVETSNVNVMSEMVDLISTMRQVESGQKVLRGYEEMMDTAIRTIAEV